MALSRFILEPISLLPILIISCFPSPSLEGHHGRSIRQPPSSSGPSLLLLRLESRSALPMPMSPPPRPPMPSAVYKMELRWSRRGCCPSLLSTTSRLHLPRTPSLFPWRQREMVLILQDVCCIYFLSCTKVSVHFQCKMYIESRNWVVQSRACLYLTCS